MLTNKDVLHAFDKLGGTFNQVEALKDYLEKNFTSHDVANAIDKALADRVLVMSECLALVQKA